jgi:hypothetical protein
MSITAPLSMLEGSTSLPGSDNFSPLTQETKHGTNAKTMEKQIALHVVVIFLFLLMSIE